MSLNMSSARSLAQEAVSWYLDNYNEFESHKTNIHQHFRGPVTALTVRMLNHHQTYHTTTAGNSNWREFLNLGDSVSLQELFQSESDLEKLSRRAKARLEAFLEGVSFAVVSDPHPLEHESIKRAGSTNSSSDSLNLVDGLVGFKAIQPNVVSTINKTRKHSIVKAPQIPENELVTRLELYLRSLYRVKIHDCVIAQEPIRALKARTYFLVNAFINTVGTVQHVSPILTKLLVSLTKELMAVPTLSPELLNVIQGIVSRYVQTTSFASLAFLSSPEISAEQNLTPAILKYLVYLQKNWEALERQCEQEEMLNSILDKHLRKTFHTSEFRSIGHLLEVCQGFRDELQSIELQCNKNCGNEFMIDQAVKDMQREVIAVNGSVLPHVNDRKELIQLLASSLNRPNVFEAKPRRKKKKTRKPKTKSTTTISDESDGLLSGNEADWSESSVDSSVQSDDVHSNGEATSTHRSITRKRGTFTINTVDMLTKRILLASSRTGTGGDAYFIVRDLFGGDGVEVVAAKPQPLSNRPATIDLWVKLASVTIKSHASFDVYPQNMVGDCEPLIQIHTTTSETIALQEVRSEKQDGNFVLQERPTESPGKRILSIRPALYEKQAVWHTPS